MEDRCKHGVQPRRGANHTGIADTSERWFYTDAGLHKNTPARRTPCIPDEAATSSRSPSRAGPMQLQHRLHQRCQDRRGATARANVASTKPCFERHVYRRGHGLCRRPHHTHTIIIMHGEREAKTTKTTTRLNRRYLAEQPAGVINREPSEAPGTRRPHNAS